jgi:hypothetical protein
MGSVGDCFDNAMCESFNATLECELSSKTGSRINMRARLPFSSLSRVLQSLSATYRDRECLSGGVERRMGQAA